LKDILSHFLVYLTNPGLHPLKVNFEESKVIDFIDWDTYSGKTELAIVYLFCYYSCVMESAKEIVPNKKQKMTVFNISLIKYFKKIEAFNIR
jgi:hypothetical protein